MSLKHGKFAGINQVKDTLPFFGWLVWKVLKMKAATNKQTDIVATKLCKLPAVCGMDHYSNNGVVPPKCYSMFH